MNNTSVLISIDDAANGVCVQVWRAGDLLEDRSFNSQARYADKRVESNINRACDYASKLCRKYGVETWQTN